jgi:hypothetical protein
VTACTRFHVPLSLASSTRRFDQRSQTRPRIFSHAMTNIVKSTRKNIAKPMKARDTPIILCIVSLLTSIAFKQISTNGKRWSPISFTQGKSKVDEESKQTDQFHTILDGTLSKNHTWEERTLSFHPVLTLHFSNTRISRSRIFHTNRPMGWLSSGSFSKPTLFFSSSSSSSSSVSTACSFVVTITPLARLNTDECESDEKVGLS